MGNTFEMILTIIGLSFWILFPIGMFLSVSRLDKNTDQVVRLKERREADIRHGRYRRYTVRHFDWHHPILYFRRWINEP